MERLETKIGNIRMRTPLMALSGVFGIEYLTVLPDLAGIGAVVTKSVTYNRRDGNRVPRIIPTPAGLLNSIGLHNPGIHAFLSEIIPKLRVLEVPIIASVAGFSIEEYVKCASLLAPRDEIEGIELNVSCPNIEKGSMEFGCEPSMLKSLVAKVKRVVGTKTLIVKLTPNVTDIALPTQAAVEGGADAISLINTLRGMAIDLNTQKPILGNVIGGLSGQAIHPIAVYMVYRSYTSCCRKNNIPIIGMGGVSKGEEAVELILAGAACVGVGTRMFRNQLVFKEIEDFLIQYTRERNISILDLVGKATD